MSCPGCGRANRAGARFCGGCGASLAPRCPACGATTEPDARFCDACGAALAAAAAADSVARKVVTIVFADLIGSTALHERLDPESVSRVMEAYHAAVRAPIEAHGGTVVQLLGDGVMCAFGVPQVAEDDALRAVRAAVDVQRSFREFLRAHEELAGRVGLRVAVNTGEVVVSDDYAAGIGDPLNVAARLQQEAKDGDVLVGGATQRFVADQVTLAPVGSFALKGRAEPVVAWRVVSLERPARAAAAAFVGRAEELRRLGAVYEAAVSSAHARLAVVLGSPGLGKSRLLVELARGVAGRATVLVAQCSASGGATFAPLAEPLRAALGAAALPDDAERARIEAGIGALLAGTPAPPEETFFVVRRLLASLAADLPVVLVIDDLQWAEPLLLDLVEHLVQWGAGVRLFVLAAARPELRDLRSSLVSAGGLVSDVLHLSGLDASASTRLAASVIGADALPAAVAGRVLATSEGNPLFLGELVRMLVNDGVLRREGERWVTAVELSDLDMPPNIQALLAARIERLRLEERLVLERAAVVGRQFSRAAVAHLLPREARGELDARLESLRRSELIELDGGWFLGEPALRFHHVLIRDAAYRRPLRHTRAELHARFADWLAERAGGDAALHDETIGWHLEQAFQHRRELGALDAEARALGQRAARHLADAGRRALARDDLPRAASGLGRALDCLDAADPARAELALDWCEALLAAGDVAPAARALAELGRFTAGSERLRAWHTSFAGQLAVLSDPQALRASDEAVAAAADTLAAAGDAAGEAKAHSVHALVLAQLGRIGACEAALDRALAAARRARDRRRANAVLAGAPVAALWGPSPVTRASGRCLDVVRVLRITQGAPAVEAVALRCQAVLETLRGRSEAARRMIASSRRMVEELGIGQRVLEADVFAGLIELLEGDGAAAERWLRPAYVGLREQRLDIDAAQAAALLGRALLVQDRAEEAEALSRESEALAGDSFKAAIAWRCVRAEALAARGEHEGAVEAARAAVEIAAATDDLLDHADARHALAVALRAAGRGAEAAAEEARAIALWEEKGATLLVERARDRAGATLAEPESEPRPGAARSPRRVRENAATANAVRIDAAVAARDFAALDALYAENATTLHHPTGGEYDRAALLRGLRATMEAAASGYRQEPLATLGDALALCRTTSFASGAAVEDFEVGAVEREHVTTIEVDAQGRRLRSDVFAPARLANAIVRLYERHAELLAEGPERQRAAETARTIGAMLAERFDPERYATVFARQIEALDHRTLGTHSGRGADALLDGFRAWLALAREATVRSDAVLALRPDALLERITFRGADAAGGGAFERPFIRLLVFGADGLLARIEWFDRDCDAEALGRFDALATEPAASRFENAAVRAGERFMRAWEARDWDAMIAGFAPEFEADDRRALVGVPMSGPEFFANQRHLFAMKSSRWEGEVLATRGERYALRRARFGGVNDAGGAAEVLLLTLTEVDGTGRYVWQALFDRDAVEAAYQALDARYVAGEGAAYTALLANLLEFRRALAAADREALARILPDDFTVTSHRRFANVGATLSRDEYVANLGFYDELGVRAGFRVEHLRVSESALILDATLHGTRAGSDFEQLFLLVATHDRNRFRGWELFDRDATEIAFARFGELSAEPDAPRIENAATRVSDRIHAAWRARDWAAFSALYAPGYRIVDRQRGVQLESTRAVWLDSYRPVFEMASSQLLQEVLATRGERLGLFHVSWRGADGAVGASELDVLLVAETDEQGGLATQVVLDPDALDVAWAELDARFFGGEAGAYPLVARTMQSFLAAFARRDWDALGALFAEDVGVSDHRRLGWEPLSGRAAYVVSLRSLVDLSPDVRLRLDHARLSARGVLWVASWLGTREGGPFETPWIIVSEHDTAGVVRRFDQFDVDRLDAALARFAELGSDPLRIPENAARRASLRLHEAFVTGDLDAFEALVAPGLRFDDRRRGLRSSGGRVEFLASARLIQASGSRPERTLLATAGERLALEHALWRNERLGTEVETLDVVELDADGRLAASVSFDPGERRAASLELTGRSLRGEASAWMPPGVAEFVNAVNARDLERVRAALAADFVAHDHRRTGMGRIEGVDQYVASLAALFGESRDVTVETLCDVVVAPPGYLAAGRTFGTLAGGGSFESVYLRLMLWRDGRCTRVELFELDQLERARARLEELRPDPLAVPPNAAVRAADRIRECMRAGDWVALRALVSRDFTFEDRRRLALVNGDIELYARNLEVVRSYPNLKPSRELLTTLGERLALSRLSYTGGGEADAFEGEFLVLNELDGEMRLRAVLHFDPEERAAAIADAHARFVAGEAGGQAEQAAISALAAAFVTRDWGALRTCFTPAAAVRDHRTLGLGVQSVDEWIASLRAAVELAPDVRPEPIRILAWRDGGRVSVLRVHGHREGSPFENVFIGVAFARGGQVESYEFFDVDDADRALARFEELCASPR